MAKPSGVGSSAEIEDTTTIDLENSKQSRYIRKKMKDWDRYEFMNDNLWDAFMENFEDYTEDTFNFVSKNDLRGLRSYLRKRGVWVQGGRMPAAPALANTLKEKRPTKWTEDEIRDCNRQDKFISGEIIAFMDHLVEEDAKEKEPQTPQQHQEYDRRTSFYPTSNSSGKQQGKQRQSALFQPHKFDQAASSQAEKNTQNQPAAAKENATDAANPASHSERFQSEERAQSKFQQYTSPAPQPQQFAPRQPTVSIPPAPTYVAAFGPTYISAANPAFSAPNLAFSAAPAFAPSGYAKEIANMAKLYTEEMKYEGKNDNFGHKFTLFHHFCSKADLPHEVRSKALSFMLKGFALDYYLANVNMLENATLDQACTFISTHFENPDHRRNNLQRWNQTTLKSVMTKPENQGKSTLDCLEILINDLRHMQHGLAPNLQNEDFMQNHLIIACEEVPACRFACYKPNATLAGQISDLQTSISTYEKTHPNHQIGAYQTENYFTDRRFHGRQSVARPRSLNRPPDRSSRDQDSDRSLIPYDRKRKKRCFVCDKEGCWSTNHTREERDAARARLKERFIKHDRFDDRFDQRIAQYMTEYIADYEGYDPDAGLVDEMGAYTMNLTLSAPKPSHPSAPTKPDNPAINYYHDDVVTGPEASDRYDYAYY